MVKAIIKLVLIVSIIKLRNREIEDLSKTTIEEIYLIDFVLNKIQNFTFWYTDDIDGFLLNENKKIRTFSNRTEAKSFAQTYGFKMIDEAVIISSDIVFTLDTETLNCDVILTYWNILSDVAMSVNRQFLGDSRTEEIQKIYNKLFYGCNLPAIKKDGDDFLPIWSEKEVQKIVEVIENGLQILSDSLE